MNTTTPSTLDSISSSHRLIKSFHSLSGSSEFATSLGIRVNNTVSEMPNILDLGAYHPAASSLSVACEALTDMLPTGMSLRRLGSFVGDRQTIYDHWMGLGAEGLRTRFFMTQSPWLLRQRAFDLDFENPRFAGIFDELGTLACLAEWAQNGAQSMEAEAAFSTTPSHRRKGLAKIAAAACALDARANGIVTLRIDTLRENRAAQNLAASLGGAREILPMTSMSDPISAVIDLKATGPDSIESRMRFKSA